VKVTARSAPAAAAAAEPLRRALEGLFRASDDALAVLRVELDEAGGVRDFVVLEANRRFEQYAGMPVLGKGLGDVPLLAAEQWPDLLADAALDRRPAQVCMAGPQPGSWFEVQLIAAAKPGDRLVGVRMRDITQQRRREEQLQALRHIRTVGVMVWDASFKLADVNDGFLQMSGFAREEVLGKTWQELTPPEFHAVSWNAVRQVLTLGEAVPFEKEYLRKDGSRWWGLFAPRKMGDEAIEFVLDVTERRAAEGALREADRRKDEFLATLAHELRNPLAPIRNGLQILRLATPGEAPARRTLQIMDRQLAHLVHLVDDLLDVARVTAGKVRLDRQVVPVSELLARSLEATQDAIDARKHRLELQAPAEDVLVAGDVDRLIQVFINLLSNAAKYTPTGGLIRVAAAAGDETVRVQVRDNGIGIAPEQQAHVFELFSQVRDHQKHSEGGLGIGLALVRSLVQLQGGSITVHSEGIGRGSTFEVRLPRVHGSASARTAATAPAASAHRILVADDNADAAETLASLLRADGHEVATAANGAEAVQLAMDFRPDVAFIDLGMPVMDGFEAARRIRGQVAGKKMRLVALTGWGQPADRRRTAEAGFDLHLVKPLTTEGLSQALAAPDWQTSPTALQRDA